MACLPLSYYNTMHDLEFHWSARKHGIADDDIRHAVRNALAVFDIDSEEGPAKVLFLGPDRSANLLEVVAIELDDGGKMAIHAMRMRPKYNQLLGGDLDG